MPATIAHFTTDTLPRVVESPAGSLTVDLVLPFRVDVPDPGLGVRSWRLDVDVEGRSWTARTRTRRLPAGLAAALRDRLQRQGRFVFDHLPYYAALRDDEVVANRAVYVEGRVPGVPVGALVTYTLTAVVGRADERPIVSSRMYTTRAVSPQFDRTEIKRIFIPDVGRADEAWVLYHQRDDALDRFRVDVVELSTGGVAPERVPLAVRVGGTVLDLGAGEPAVLPLVDTAADSVTFAVPHGGGALPPVSVRFRGIETPVDLADRRAGETRLMFVNFAIQGLNDLFATADDDYTPPRTYIQVTMRDEAASYSSRPGSRERHAGDGYGFTLDAHRRFEVPQLWAMNGGLLALLAHDCPDELEAMRTDVAAGLLQPVVAGYGAHRLPYYRTETNTDAIRFGSEAMRKIVGATSAVYYPDSRITTNTANVVDALREARVEYLVVDAGEGEGRDEEATTGNTVVHDAKPALGATTGTRYASWQNLWHDRITDTKVLFIDREMKDNLLQADDWEADRGKVKYALRRKFIELAAQPELRAGNLVVYSDDADKASGNGWFDGFYDGSELPYNHRYQAALSWVSKHPWVRAITTAALAGEAPVGDLELVRASDPKIKDWHLGGFEPVTPAEPSFGLDFDTWYVAWAHTRAAWLGETLRAVSTRAENAIARRRADGAADDELVCLARLYFTLCLHESQWSKRARIGGQSDPGGTDPENFVLAESVQLRNAHVYLNASFWAGWAAAVARGEERPGAYRDCGPVVDAVATFERACTTAEDGGPPAWSREGTRGLQWDHDPLPNVVLYNPHALVVIDLNGGRITHLFAMVDGRPVSVSGTFKAYQFLDMDWASDSGVECDGVVLHNTVATPNHAYVACDTDASAGTVGSPPPGDTVLDWYYPDNFNAYEVAGDPSGPAGLPEVTLTYGPATGDSPPPDTLTDLDEALEADRADKIAGNPGLVLHDTEAFGSFHKTIRLDDRTVHVEYADTRPGHRIANEFCVDLLAAALHGTRQNHEVADDGRSATVTNDAGLAVRLELGGGCAFTEAAGTPIGPTEALRLHRVMTDNLEIVATDGGLLTYRVVLP
jgi:hypothetical protein